MMKLLTIPILLITLMFSSTSYAEWTKLNKDVNGTTFYLDFERIKKHDGYVYFWILNDYLKPLSGGSFSGKFYVQGDCKLFRMKTLSTSLYKEPMSKGTGETFTPPDKWKYLPNSVLELVTKSLCNE